MDSAPANTEIVRQHAHLLLDSLGVSRIVVVDDEYSGKGLHVAELLGLLSVLSAAQRAGLPHLDEIDFEADSEIWSDLVRQRWGNLAAATRTQLVFQAESLAADAPAADADIDSAEERPPVLKAAEDEGGAGTAEPDASLEVADQMWVDSRAAKSLEEILEGLKKCTFLTLSLEEWRLQKDELLGDERAATTVYLFDRDFSREFEAAENEGFKLIREIQSLDVGYCGLISHTIPLGGEYEAWAQLADEHSLDRDRFIVLAKKCLTGETPDHYSFLRMLRLAALSRRFTDVKSSVWSAFNASVAEAKAAVERLWVYDFDQIVFASSRREGVWEPETLVRVFGILMRREAQSKIYQDASISNAVAKAREISALPKKLALALGEEPPSLEARRIQRFGMYESEEALNRCYLPIDLGDIFFAESIRQYFILLTQPCDLMVRAKGRRKYENSTQGRTATLVELGMSAPDGGAKASCELMHFFDQDTGTPAFANFARVHQAKLAVLDLCAFRKDGVVKIAVEDDSPALVIAPWQKRYKRLQSFFSKAIECYAELSNSSNELKSLALPKLSATVDLPAAVKSKILEYDLRRVMRLRQPWSGAMLTALTQYQARAAFEHEFERPVPKEAEPSGDQVANET